MSHVEQPSVRLLDHAGEEIGWITQERACEMERAGDVRCYGTKTRIRAAKLLIDGAALTFGGHGMETRHGSAGDAHRHESYYNPGDAGRLTGCRGL